MPPGLIRRNGRYSLRKRIPSDLTEHYGKAEIVRALGTSDPKEARIRLAKATVVLHDEFAKARREIAAPRLTSRDPEALSTNAGPSEPFDAGQFANRAFATLRRKREDAAERNDLPAFNEWLKDQLSWQQSALDHGPIVLPGETPATAVAKAEGARTALRAMITGEGVAALDDVRSVARISGAASGRRVRLTYVCERWSAERTPKPRAVKIHERVVRRFEEVNGALIVADITKAHVLSFKDHLVAEGQSPANTNSILSRLNTLLNYAVCNDFAASNPAKGARVADNRRRKDKRREWDAEALNRLFSSPVYTSDRRPLAGGGEAAYWLPLLALYTGARQTELGQLHPHDVVEESYPTASGEQRTAWVIRIVENALRGQSVKNEGSERRVPIHADLIGLGFLRLVSKAKASGLDRLFPDIRPGAHNELMGNWSKWFGRYRKAAGVVGDDTPFHSFRHSFKHYARLSGMARETSNELTGHETGDVGDDYGGLSYPLAPLVEGISIYRVPGMKLPAPPRSL